MRYISPIPWPQCQFGEHFGEAPSIHHTNTWVRKFNSEQMGATLSPRLIYRVAGVHDGKPFTATVGEPFERLREVVVAILLDTSRDVYFICTANRGVLRGEPYLSGAHEIRDAKDFEA